MTAVVLQLSDTHLAPDPGDTVFGRDADARLATVVDAVERSGAAIDLVLLTGDLTNEGGLAPMQRLHDAVAALGRPMMAIPGNHDHPDEVGSVFGASTDVELGGWRVVGFDTTVPGQTAGRIDVAAALRSIDSRPSVPTVVALHHPPRSRSTHPQFQLAGAEELLAALSERTQVKAVVGGHLHDAFELPGPGGLPILGCPSTVMAISHQGDDMTIGDGDTGARILELGEDGRVSSRLLVA